MKDGAMDMTVSILSMTNIEDAWSKREIEVLKLRITLHGRG